MGGSSKKPKMPAKVPAPVAPQAPGVRRGTASRNPFANVGQGVVTGPLGVIGGAKLVNKTLLGE